LSLDKLSITSRKHLTRMGLRQGAALGARVLKDVNKLREIGELHCMSPIHRYLDSNLKILKLFSLEAIERADMSRLPR